MFIPQAIDTSYQDIIKQYSKDFGTNNLIYYMGLAAEAGEVLNDKVKSLKDSRVFTQEEITSELGDVLYYVTAIATANNIFLSSCFKNNLDKVKERAEKRNDDL